MAAQHKLDTLGRLRTAGLVAVLHHADPDTAWQMVDALCQGGFAAVEFTNRGDHAIEAFTLIERNARMHHPDCVVGVGSVVDAGTATMFMNAGTDFVVGPALVAEVAVTCNRRQVPYIPGCGTLGEMLRANELGCEVVKAFPAASLGGPDFVKAVKAPCPWLEVMPTGGVEATSDDLRAWFDAGVFAVGLGSKLVPQDAIDAGDWSQLTTLAEQAVATLAAVR